MFGFFEGIRLNLGWRDGRLVVTSEDVPGLFLSGEDYRTVMLDVIPAIETLLEHNEGISPVFTKE